MKVLFISKYARTGGAAIAGYRLMQALRNHPVDVSMLVQDEKDDENAAIFNTTGTFIKKMVNLHRFLLERICFIVGEESRSVRFLFSLANTGEKISGNVHVKEADILHLHWINGGFLSLRSIQDLLNSGKPIIWTFHDMWAFTGGCHYSLDCKEYMLQCGNCPYVKKRHAGDLSNRIWKKKEKIFSKGKFVVATSSNWLKECTLSSSLLGNYEIHSIPIPIDQTIFFPIGKETARTKLGFNKEKKYILFGAANIRNMLKGLDYFLEAVQILFKDMGGDDSVEIILLGKSSDDLTGLIPFKTHQISYTGSLEKIVDIYNAAQVFVIPSLQDNLPNTIIESLSCGTPVVGFNSGGIPEMVDHKINGYLAEYKSYKDLATGMKWILTSEDYEKLSANARKKAEKDYSPESSSGKYMELYQKLLEQ